MTRVFVLIAALSFLSIGCVRAPGGIAASNIPLDPGGYTILGPVDASDCKVNLFGILPVSGANETADAMREAQGDIPGANALINITVETNSKFFILWSSTCTGVRATAVSVP